MSLRMQDFKCSTHGAFEVMLELSNKPEDADARWDAVRSHACPTCGEASPSIWTKAPGMNGFYRHVVTVAGHTHDAEDIERFLSPTSTPTPFYESPEFEGRFMDAYKRNEERAVAGTLPPVNTPEEVQAAVSAIKE